MQKGFSLIEVLTVVTVTAVVSGVGFVMTEGVREKSRQHTCAKNLHDLYVGLQLYSNEYQGPEQMPGLGTIKLLPVVDNITPYIPSHDILYCPNTPPRLKKEHSFWSTYELNIVLMPPTKDKKLQNYADTFKYDLENLGSRAALAICNLHDETYYGPREQDVDPDLAQPFQLRLQVDGKVDVRRFAAKRHRTFLIN